MSAKYDQLIYETAIKQGFSPTAAKLVVAQARFESADYSSNVFKNNLNTSGMKYIGQRLATRGSLAPLNERSKSCQESRNCVNSDHYAKFNSVADSARDKIERNFEKTMGGVTPQQLKNAKTAEEFAALLKKRRYYGSSESEYARGLKSKLMRIQVVEFIDKNKNMLLIGIGLIAISLGYYFYYRKKA
jgi:LPXTG-motif cell wall-anchored protein